MTTHRSALVARGKNLGSVRRLPGGEAVVNFVRCQHCQPTVPVHRVVPGEDQSAVANRVIHLRQQGKTNARRAWLPGYAGRFRAANSQFSNFSISSAT